jgi:hypothetical protein
MRELANYLSLPLCIVEFNKPTVGHTEDLNCKPAKVIEGKFAVQVRS